MNKEEKVPSLGTESSSTAYRYSLEAGVLLQLDRDSKAIIRYHKPLSTKILQIAQRNSGIIVQEEYYKFRGISNLYCVDYEFKLIWSAEQPDSHDVYINGFQDCGDYIACHSFGCYNCKISPATGKILSMQFTK